MAPHMATRIRCEKVIRMTLLVDGDGNLIDRREILCVKIVHISVAMRYISISTLADHVVVAGHWEEAQFFELLEYYLRDPEKRVCFIAVGEHWVEARNVEIFSWTWHNN